MVIVAREDGRGVDLELGAVENVLRENRSKYSFVRISRQVPRMGGGGDQTQKQWQSKDKGALQYRRNIFAWLQLTQLTSEALPVD